MREILFRGKRTDNGEWVYGDIINSWYLQQTKSTYCIYNNIGRFEVIPDTVGQYTGIKDKNGNKIFEGDIVKSNYIYKDNIGVVYWNTLFCGYHYDGYRTLYGDGSDVYEVIGNIHDNPKLSKGE